MNTTTLTKRVYVPNKGTHDYSDAWNFGEVIFCTEGFVNRKDLLSMQADLNAALADAEPDDFILLTSLTTICSVACSIFAHKFGRLNLLIFEDGKYLERFLTFDN